VPGDGNQPVEIVPRDRRLGRHRGHALETFQLLASLLLGLLRHPRLLDLFLQLIELAALVFLATQFFLDRLHLFVEVVLLLRLLHLLLDARLDPAVDLQLVHLGFEKAGNPDESLER
jgi:hypothetical protein